MAPIPIFSALSRHDRAHVFLLALLMPLRHSPCPTRPRNFLHTNNGPTYCLRNGKPCLASLALPCLVLPCLALPPYAMAGKQRNSTRMQT